MKLLVKILSLFIIFDIYSQGLVINNTASFVVSANANLVIFENGGIYNVGDRVFNINSNVLFTSLNTTNQFIGGMGVITFGNLYINKGLIATPDMAGEVYLSNVDTRIANVLNLSAAGHFDLKNQIADLGTTGQVVGENQHSRIRATDASWNDGGGIGIIRAIRNDPSGNVAGLGLNITPSAALGNNTVIIRGCNPLQGSGTFTGNWSVFRWYRIQPGTGTYTPITVNNFYYWGGAANAELNGHTEANLQMFQRVQYWNGTTNPIYWEPRTTTTVTGSDYVSSTTTNNTLMLIYIEVTLGSTDNPLPVEYLSFKAFCNNSINTITWQTVSENNNLGFNIEKSNDGIEWENLGFVAGNDNTNAVSSYYFNDNFPYSPITYYRLQQIDYDGQSNYSSIISITCNQENTEEEIVPLYNNGQLILNIYGNINNNYKIIVTNAIGQLIVSKHIQLENSIQSINIDGDFAQGIYYISLLSDKSILSKPLLIKK